MEAKLDGYMILDPYDVNMAAEIKETFDLAQKLTQVKRVVKNHFDDINIFAGLLYCADCGFPFTLRRVAKNRNYDFTFAQSTTDGRRFSVRRIRF